MRAAEIDRTQARGKDDRELLETIYSAMVTADPTPLVPHPTPGLIDRVDGMDKRLERLERGRAIDAQLAPDGTVTGTVAAAPADEEDSVPT